MILVPLARENTVISQHLIRSFLSAQRGVACRGARRGRILCLEFRSCAMSSEGNVRDVRDEAVTE